MFKIKPTTINVVTMGEPTEITNWKKQKELGSGSFGTVCLWVNKHNGDSLAIKKCKWNLETLLTQRQKERWTSEVEMMKKINHNNIVAYRKIPEDLEQVLLSYNPSNLPILSMEYCSSGNLRDLLCNPKNSCGLSEIEVIQILKDISSALNYLHKLSITHRDVKPENIVLQMSNTTKSAICYKLIDLGYAKDLNTNTVSFVGTLQYLAPEIFSKKTYDCKVDYWSLGITAFEIICGIRPFLPAFTAIQCYKYLETKEHCVISIQHTHSGEMNNLKELPKEIYINACLKIDLERWLQLVLEFDSEKRGVLDNNNINVFDNLQEILSKKIITVFCVYTYEFYSYEVKDSTLFSTLQDWIARDLKIIKSDQCLITTRPSNSNYAKDYYDEDNPDAMIFVLRKRESIGKVVGNPFPKLIFLMFEKSQTQFKYGTLKLLHAQLIYLILNETKYFNCTINSIYYSAKALNNLVVHETKHCAHLKDFLNLYLSEIEFYNYMQQSQVMKSISSEQHVRLLMEYQNYMNQLKEIVQIVNALIKRCNGVLVKNHKLQLAKDMLSTIIKYHDFDEMLQEAVSCYNNIEANASKNFTAKPHIWKIVSSTLKSRQTFLSNPFFTNFIRAVVSLFSELEKLQSSRTALKAQLTAIKIQVRQNVIERLKLLQDFKSKDNNRDDLSNNNDNVELLRSNATLRYELQEFMNSALIKYAKLIRSDEMLASSFQNGETQV